VEANATPPSDASLVAQVAAGDERAFAEIYDRSADAVLRVAMRLLGDRHASEEIVQETYLVLWNKAERFDPALGSLLGWLAAIARNRATDRLRAAGRRPVIVGLGARSDDDDRADAFDLDVARGQPVAAAAVDQDPAEAAARRWTRGVVRDALARSPADERLALELAYYGGLSQSEIADRLGWPLGTVKTRTRRALARLRGELADVLDPEPGPETRTGGSRGSR
jgi:RNA polymerase sigma-70 factor, ECF subfamily